MKTLATIALLCVMVLPCIAQDVTEPIVELTGPGKQTTVYAGSPLSLMANAWDESGIVRVEWTVMTRRGDTEVVAVDTTPPYYQQWLVPQKRDTLYFVTAWAYDAAGNVGRSETSWVWAIK